METNLTDVIEEYALLQAKANVINNRMAELKAILFDSMEVGQEILHEGYEVTKVRGTVRESVDGKKLKAEDPDTYLKYLKQTSVKPHIRFVDNHDKWLNEQTKVDEVEEVTQVA